jgi:hypothetical protein
VEATVAVPAAGADASPVAVAVAVPCSVAVVAVDVDDPLAWEGDELEELGASLDEAEVLGVVVALPFGVERSPFVVLVVAEPFVLVVGDLAAERGALVAAGLAGAELWGAELDGADVSGAELVGAGVAESVLVDVDVGVGVGVPDVAGCCCCCQVLYELIRDHSVQCAVSRSSPLLS